MPSVQQYYVPTLGAEFRRVYTPSGERYLNDHTIVRDDRGTCHVFGITDDSDGRPFEEESFLHATAARLDGTWSEAPDALFAEPVIDGCFLRSLAAEAPGATRTTPGASPFEPAMVVQGHARREGGHRGPGRAREAHSRDD